MHGYILPERLLMMLYNAEIVHASGEIKHTTNRKQSLIVMRLTLDIGMEYPFLILMVRIVVVCYTSPTLCLSSVVVTS